MPGGKLSGMTPRAERALVLATDRSLLRCSDPSGEPSSFTWLHVSIGTSSDSQRPGTAAGARRPGPLSGRSDRSARSPRSQTPAFRRNISAITRVRSTARTAEIVTQSESLAPEDSAFAPVGSGGGLGSTIHASHRQLAITPSFLLG